MNNKNSRGKAVMKVLCVIGVILLLIISYRVVSSEEILKRVMRIVIITLMLVFIKSRKKGN